MRVLAPKTSELQREMNPGLALIDRRWGLSVVKSAYAEMYPDCNLQFIEEIAKRVEQGVFKKTSSSQDYQKTIKSTSNSITTLARKTAQHKARKELGHNAPESAIHGAMHLPRNEFHQTSVGNNQSYPAITQGARYHPDPSDVVNFVPFILEAGVQVLGRIEIVQQVRALDERQRSTIGFLAFEKMSQMTGSGERGPAAAPGTACQPLDGNSAPLNLQEFKLVSNRIPNGLSQDPKPAPSMTFAEMKAKYREDIERLWPVIEIQLRQRKNEGVESNEDLELHQIISYVRAGMAQDNVTNPDALQSLETLSVQILNLFGHLLTNDVSAFNEAERNPDQDNLSIPCLRHGLDDNTDYSVDLGDTDSDTEDDKDEECHPEQQSVGYGCDSQDYEQRGNEINGDDHWDENGLQEHTFGTGELLDDPTEPNFADNFLEEILAQQGHALNNLQMNVQESIAAGAGPEMMTLRDSDADRQFELLLESINEKSEPQDSFGLEPIPLAGIEDTVKNTTDVGDIIQKPQTEEGKTEEVQASASPDDHSVPAVTPRRSNRIRTKTPASTIDHLGGKSTVDASKTPRSKKEAPANTVRTRKTPRRTPRKTPRK